MGSYSIVCEGGAAGVAGVVATGSFDDAVEVRIK